MGAELATKRVVKPDGGGAKKEGKVGDKPGPDRKVDGNAEMSAYVSSHTRQHEHVDATRLYLSEIGFSPLLTAEEEVYYARRARKGDRSSPTCAPPVRPTSASLAESRSCLAPARIVPDGIAVPPCGYHSRDLIDEETGEISSLYENPPAGGLLGKLETSISEPPAPVYLH